MAGEQVHRKISKVVTEEAKAAVQAAEAESGTAIAVKIPIALPKWVVPSLLSLLAGGGLGSGVAGVVKDNQPVTVVSVTKEQVRAELDKELDKQRAEMRETILALHKRLDSLDNKLDSNGTQLQGIKLDTAIIRGRQ